MGIDIDFVMRFSSNCVIETLSEIDAAVTNICYSAPFGITIIYGCFLNPSFFKLRRFPYVTYLKKRCLRVGRAMLLRLNIEIKLACKASNGKNMSSLVAGVRVGVIIPIAEWKGIIRWP